MTDDMNQLFNNLKSLEDVARTLNDPQKIVSLYESAIDMIFESEHSKKVIKVLVVEMMNHITRLENAVNNMMPALERADAFVTVCVNQLLGIIDNNNMSAITDEQSNALQLVRWTVELVLNDHGGAPSEEQIAMVDEMHELAIELGFSTNPDHLRKIIDDNE